MVTVLMNADVFDGVSDALRRRHVVVEDGKIIDITDDLPVGDQYERFDLAGHTLMPGLIDAHVHVYWATLDATKGDRMPITLVAHRARRMLEASLNRGFTTVRDAGGADQGLHRAIELGWISGPRLVYCGKALSQTGGHGDMRHPDEYDSCDKHSYVGHNSRVVNGTDEIRLAIREEFRRGASFIKIMGSGGDSSPADALYNSQFSDEEITAAVDETTRFGSYVTAHVHPDGAIRRCIELGVPCLEHVSLISDSTADLASKRDVSVIPTLSVGRRLARHGHEFGFPAASLAKAVAKESQAMHCLERLKRANVRVGFGSDMIGELERYQCDGLLLHGEFWSPFEVLRSATSTTAEIIRMGDRIGQIAPGFIADVIAVSGNPLEDLALFTEDGENVDFVMKAGKVLKDDIVNSV